MSIYYEMRIYYGFQLSLTYNTYIIQISFGVGSVWCSEGF